MFGGLQVTTQDEAEKLVPNYMVDKGYQLGASFSRDTFKSVTSTINPFALHISACLYNSQAVTVPLVLQLMHAFTSQLCCARVNVLSWLLLNLVRAKLPIW